jgi:wyosine [tRNA(Phe)-imidazoG37] synthetase (radical SAM superfamily)
MMSGFAQADNALVFGPVPSRRLGRSVGINNIPAKTCSYSCVYCQLGRTTQLMTSRKSFYRPEQILAQVKEKVEQCRADGERIDYLTFVPDGEPTLDANLGREIEMLTSTGIPVAVLTNTSIIDRAEVRDDLAKADLVSLKVDASSEPIWRKVNRPYRSISLPSILEGMRDFSKRFRGKLISETMLIDGVNDNEDEILGIAEILRALGSGKAYVAVPTRPPAEQFVRPASERTLNLAYQALSSALGKERVEFLMGFEGDAFTSTGNVEADLLAITSVHPMRKDAVEHFLKRTNTDWSIMNKLIAERKLIALAHSGHTFYMRRLPSRQ